MESEPLNPQRVEQLRYEDAEDRTTRVGISSYYQQIALSSLVTTVPMVVLSFILLYLIFTYKVDPTYAPFESLRGNTSTEAGWAVYVDLNSTLLIFVSSWASSLAPLLIGFTLTLASFPIAKTMQRGISRNVESLPTPYQTALLLQFLNGSVASSLWQWITYLTRWRGSRQSQSASILIAAFVSICATLLCVAVVAADSWLHFVTKSINWIQVQRTTNRIDYSMAFPAHCWSEPWTDLEYNGCSVSGGRSPHLVNSTVANQLLNNASLSAQVLTYNNTYTYLGVPMTEEVSRRDYTARSYGLQTKCEVSSARCNLHNNASEIGFNCTSDFAYSLNTAEEDLFWPNWALKHFSNANMLLNRTDPSVQNPFFFGLAALIGDVQGDELLGPDGKLDPEIVSPLHGGFAFVLSCNATVYDIEYDMIDGAVARFSMTRSNETLARIYRGPMDISAGTPQLIQATRLATASKTVQKMVDDVALAYSRAALAAGSGSITTQPALAAQERTSHIVARVPVAPLVALIAANFLFVLFGLGLTIIGLSSCDRETKEVQARLNTIALVAHYFEGPRTSSNVDSLEGLFEEHDGRDSTRVVIEPTIEGGYRFTTCRIKG